MNSWHDLIAEQQALPYFKEMTAFIEQQRQQGKVIYPEQKQIYSAFDATPFAKVKVVILGQDPYHGEGQAHGLSFSVLPGTKIPPSLRNMYKELANDISSFEIPSEGYLQGWAEQGVLLLNTVLTVEEGKAHSHAKCGWETFTDAVISALNEHKQGVVFLLWGAHAQKKGKMIDRALHTVLSAPHPSPLSAHRGFFGCGHFSKANLLLSEQGSQVIDWQV